MYDYEDPVCELRSMPPGFDLGNAPAFVEAEDDLHPVRINRLHEHCIPATVKGYA